MKKVILVGRYSVIEPLGIIHLVGLATSRGYDVEVELVVDNDFSSLYKIIKDWNPDLVCFQVWTGQHIQTFEACDNVKKMGFDVVIGGPHATYFTEECGKHADWVVRGEGFRMFRKILDCEIPKGIYFDCERLAEGFSVQNREIVYNKYPVLRASKIKSIITSLGCPFTCSYCYAPVWNGMYGGFKHIQRSVDDIIQEGLEIKNQWGAEMVYFQDDIFGYSLKWLAEFSKRWLKEVGIPWHCQIRLELTQGKAGDRRLDIFKQGGCTGITLAMESGDPFLREHVLRRPMADSLIIEGCAKIKSRGLTLRLEQILAIPFSNLETDLLTLRLNNIINPEMAWTSILAPYMGTFMGELVNKFIFYNGNNDDINPLFFDRSVLRHSKNAREVIEIAVTKTKQSLLQMKTKINNPLSIDIFSSKKNGDKDEVYRIDLMDDIENNYYVDQIIVLQRLFMWFSLVPKGDLLAKFFVTLSREEWTWEKLGFITEGHFKSIGLETDSQKWILELVECFGVESRDELPEVVRDNPYYFVFFPSSAEFAKFVMENNIVDKTEIPGRQFDKLSGVARSWLFDTSLYKVIPSKKPIAK